MLNPFPWKVYAWERWIACILGNASGPEEIWILASPHATLLESKQRQTNLFLINNVGLQMSCTTALSPGSMQNCSYNVQSIFSSFLLWKTVIISVIKTLKCILTERNATSVIHVNDNSISRERGKKPAYHGRSQMLFHRRSFKHSHERADLTALGFSSRKA